MMKRMRMGLMLLAALALAGSACNESSSGGGFSLTGAAGTSRDHRWDLMLTNLDLSASKFTVTVVRTGTSGNAVVAISDETTAYGNETVDVGVPIPLGGCGFTITFLDAGQPFTLAAGDAWVVMTVAGTLAGPAYPTALPQSTNVLVAPGGANTCSSTCATGLFEGLPNLTAALLKLYPSLPNIPFSLAPALQVLVSSYTQEANVPEVYLLSFSTLPAVPGPSPIAAGDQVQVSYTRRIVSDSKDGDFFAARLTNFRSYEFIEDLAHREMKAGDTRTITYTATAQGDFLGLDLIVGLSGPADYVVLDDLSITVNGVPLLTENFEGAGLTPGPYIWLDVVPSQALGNAGFTTEAGQVLAGAQSYQFQGGRLFHLYGQAVSQAGVEAAEFSMTDGAVDSTYWQGLFMGVSQGGALVGDYNGHNFDESCQENGMFFALEDATGNADAGGNWAITLTAELNHCDPGLGYSDTLFPETAYALLINQFQTAIGGILQGNATVVDSQGNGVTFLGLVLGDLVVLQAGVTAPAFPTGMSYNAALVGAVIETDTGPVVAGAVTGLASPNLLFPPDTCELSGTFTAAIIRP